MRLRSQLPLHTDIAARIWYKRVDGFLTETSEAKTTVNTRR